jgi:hypothetical protein
MRAKKLMAWGGNLLAAGRMAAGLLLVLVAAASPALAACHDMAPEIDPGSIASAVTLLAGGALILAGRLRR